MNAKIFISLLFLVFFITCSCLIVIRVAEYLEQRQELECQISPFTYGSQKLLDQTSANNIFGSVTLLSQTATLTFSFNNESIKELK